MFKNITKDSSSLSTRDIGSALDTIIFAIRSVIFSRLESLHGRIAANPKFDSVGILLSSVEPNTVACLLLR